MENSMQNPEEEKKTGVIPNEEISGSDADKAYDQDGNFQKQTPTEETEPGKSDSPEGSDAAAGE